MSLNAEDRKILSEVQTACRNLTTKLDELDSYILTLHREVALMSNGGTNGVAEPQDPTVVPETTTPAFVPNMASGDFASRTDHLIDSVTGLRTAVAGLEKRMVGTELAASTAKNLANSTKRSTKRWRIVIAVCVVFTCAVAVLAYLNRVNARQLNTLFQQSHAQQIQINTELNEGALVRTQALCKLYDGLLNSVSPEARAAYPKGPDAYDRRTAAWKKQQGILQCPT